MHNISQWCIVMTIISVTIGLILVFMILSILCSSVQELVASVLNLRARTLRRGVEAMLGAPAAQAIYSHSLVRATATHGPGPSYIAPASFASALMDMVDTGARTWDEAKKAIEDYDGDETVKGVAQALLRTADSMDEYRARIEAWFDDSMKRVSGWYARKTKYILVLIAFLVVAAMNVDSVHIARAIWKDEVLRDRLETLGVAFVQDQKAASETALVPASAESGEGSGASGSPGEGETAEQWDKRVDEVLGLLPIGWNEGELSWETAHEAALEHALGWLITVLAISFGAPFWFDLLQKIVNVRGAGPAPRTAEASHPQ